VSLRQARHPLKLRDQAQGIKSPIDVTTASRVLTVGRKIFQKDPDPRLPKKPSALRGNSSFRRVEERCPLMAQSGHDNGFGRCPLSAVKRRSCKPPRMSLCPKPDIRTFPCTALRRA